MIEKIEPLERVLLCSARFDFSVCRYSTLPKVIVFAGNADKLENRARMFTISKSYSFSASHIIEGLPDGHPCGRLHGHNYKVELVLKRETLDECGFVVDYGDLRPFGDFINNTLDHRHLNDILPVTTSEALAKFLYEKAKEFWPETHLVRISETPKTWAEYQES